MYERNNGKEALVPADTVEDASVEGGCAIDTAVPASEVMTSTFMSSPPIYLYAYEYVYTFTYICIYT